MWDVLGIPPGSDRDTIRRAYARKLRVTQPEDDPEGFKRLREAYEAALEHQKFALLWGDSNDDDIESDELTGFQEPASEPPPLQRVATVSEQPAPSLQPEAAKQPEVEPEIAAMLAAREAELAALQAAMAELEAGLRGPWRPTDIALEERVEALLRSPVMDELRVRSDVEPWLADLIADTIPHSDAILLQAVRAFGWGNDEHRLRGTSYPVSQVLARLDEWRIIEGLNHHSHAYHAAWKSLTRPPGHWWLWRAHAFRPGVIDGVEALLGDQEDVSPGLRFSFNAESVERWRRFLAKPRLSLGLLGLIPLVFLGMLWLAYVAADGIDLDERWLIGISGLLGFATPPLILFTLGKWRYRWRDSYDHPRWQREGWIAAYPLLAFAIMLIPPPYWPAAMVLPAIGIAGWAYVAAPRMERPAKIGGGVWTCIVIGVMSLGAFMNLDAAEGVALAALATLLAYLRLSVWPAVQTVLGELTWRHREWIILGAAVAGFGMAFGIWWLRGFWQPVMPLYILMLAALALLPLMVLPNAQMGGPPRLFAWIILIGSLVWAFGASVPPKESVPPVSIERSSDVPLVESSDPLEAMLAGIEKRQPGFAQIREGNPALYMEVRSVLGRFASKQITQDQANEAIDALIDHAFRQMLPQADSALLVEGLRIRLERQRAWQKLDPARCVSGEGGSGRELPEALRQRDAAHTYDVVSTPPASAAELKSGRVIDPRALLNRAAAIAKVDSVTLLGRLNGKTDLPAACAARIAVTQAMLDNRLDDIAATLRRDAKRAGEKKTPPLPAKPIASSVRT